MKKRKVHPETIKLFAEISEGLKGYWSDSLRLDQLMIEAKTCPHCWKSLQYRGFANTTEYKAFGICPDCRYAKHFWTETAEFARTKKVICNRADKRKSARRAA